MHNTLYLGGGCFWGLEAEFSSQPGVIKTCVGYSGGSITNPTYEDHPGHAETIEITYDSLKSSIVTLLDFFFRIHDPTTLNRQGNDVGSSYRSVIFYQNHQELEQAKYVIAAVEASGLYKMPVVTQLESFNKFYPAEEYHQKYLRKHPGGYTCHYLRRTDSLL